VVCADALVVTIFFYFYSNEKLSLQQLVGGIFIVVGSCVMAGLFATGSTMLSMRPFLWCLTSMLCYAAAIISLRISTLAEVASRPALVIRFGSVGVCGLAWSLWQLRVHGLGQFGSWPLLLVWPFTTSAADCLGVYSVIRSFEEPAVITGLNTAIFGSNSVVMTLLNCFLLCYHPAMQKVLGMACVILECMTLSCAN